MKYYYDSDWKYNNDGVYDENKMLEWVKRFCDLVETEYDPEILYTNHFVEYILDLAKEYSTNVKGAGKFIKKNQKIYDSGNYTCHSADCLYKTFLYIMREVERKEIIEARRRKLEEEIAEWNKQIEERNKQYL